MFVYYDESILSYVASIRRHFGLSSSCKENDKLTTLIEQKNPKKIFLMLVDGMGANLINKKLPEDSFLRKNMLFKTTSLFPTVTTAVTTSIRNGKLPCENAWVGWVQYIKEIDDYIIPFLGTGFYSEKKYGDDFMYKISPIDFIEDELNRKNIKARRLFPAFEQDGCDNFNEMCSRLAYYSNSEDYQFIYAYWDKYDSYMHEYGPSSSISNNYLNHINYELEHLASQLSDDTMLVVIADHGQVDVKEEYNLCGSKFEKYLSLKPSLEPRATAFYIKEGMQEEFEVEFKKEFEDRFVLLTHKQVLEMSLFGDKKPHPRFEEFIGDFIAVGKANTVLAYKDKYIAPLKGQHAGICDDEIYVPVIVYQK